MSCVAHLCGCVCVKVKITLENMELGDTIVPFKSDNHVYLKFE